MLGERERGGGRVREGNPAWTGTPPSYFLLMTSGWTLAQFSTWGVDNNTCAVASIAICFPWPEILCILSNSISTLLWNVFTMASVTSDTSEFTPSTWYTWAEKYKSSQIRGKALRTFSHSWILLLKKKKRRKDCLRHPYISMPYFQITWFNKILIQGLKASSKIDPTDVGPAS